MSYFDPFVTAASFTYAIHNVVTGKYVGSQTATSPGRAIDKHIAMSPLSYQNGRYSVAAPSDKQYGIFEVTVTPGESGLDFKKLTDTFGPTTGSFLVYAVHVWEDGNYLTTQEASSPEEAIEKASKSAYMDKYFKAGQKYIVSARGQRAVGVFEAVHKPATPTVKARRVYA